MKVRNLQVAHLDLRHAVAGTWAFVLGAAAMVGFLVAIGITRNRALPLLAWTAVWTVASLTFAAAVLVAYAIGDSLAIDLALGGSFGYVLAVGLHTVHHYVELRAKELASNPAGARINPMAERRRILTRGPMLAGLLAFHGWLWVRMLVADEILLVLLLTVPVALFALRLASYARRYAALRRALRPLESPRPATE